MPGPPKSCGFIVAALVVACGAARVWAEPTVSIGFDGPETRWQLLEDGRPRQVAVHEVVREGARHGAGAERMIVAAPVGQACGFACDVGRMPILDDDWRARLWVKASRPGVQIAARLVLPRSNDPQTGRVRTTIVRGPLLQQAGHWQQLELAGISKLLAEQVRVLRMASPAPVDANEAYVDAIVLSVPGEPRGIEVLTDDLEVDGVVLAAGGERGRPGTTEVAAPRDMDFSPRGARRATGPSPNPASRVKSRVRLQGNILLVDDKQFAPRAIEWNGEPLEFLLQRGFNAIELREPPTELLLAEAEKLELWFISPPPAEDPDGGPPALWERILAWRLEDAAAQDNPAHFRTWADRIRGRADLPPRPILIAPQHEWSALADVADVLVACNPQQAALAAGHFGAWLSNCSRLARPGAPMWVSVGTQFGEAARAQASAISGKELPPISIDDDQLEAATRAAYTSGCRGFLFRSSSPLNTNDAASRRRAAAVELINRQLQLVGPWIAGGSPAGDLHSADDTTSAVMIAVDRARLVVPMGESGAGSREQGAGSGKREAISNAPTAFVIPGIPESNQAYLVTSAALRPLAAKRVAGGTRFALDAGSDGLIVITQDPQVVASLRQRIGRDGMAAVRLARELARLELESIAATNGRLMQSGFSCRPAELLTNAAEGRLRQADALLAAGRAEQADGIVSAARRNLSEAIAEQRRSLAAGETIASSPLALAGGTLAEQAEFARNANTMAAGDNLLYGGDFEDLDQLTQFGWGHFNGPIPGATGRAELASGEPRNGRYCLRVAAERVKVSDAVIRSDVASVCIVSPPIHASQGQLVEISGWARLPSGTETSSAELVVADSVGGPELALRLSSTRGWQPFRMVRAATENELRITFQLFGQGSAEIDAVMVRPLVRSVARRLPGIHMATPIGGPR